MGIMSDKQYEKEFGNIPNSLTERLELILGNKKPN